VYNAHVKYFAFLLALPALAADIRIGIIGTDTSHAGVFTKILNSGEIPGVRVVAAVKGGSPDIQESAGRVEGFAQELQTAQNVEILPDIPTLLGKVDAVLLLSNDGRKHLEQARLVLAAHKRVFIDKPLASTLEDAREIARVATQSGTPWFSSSSLRYGVIGLAKAPETTGVTTWGPGPLEAHHYLDLSWYGIHPVELLFTLMGTGCKTVTRTSSADSDVVNCIWKDGRIGTVRAIRPYSDYGAIINRGRETIVSHPKAAEAGDYHALVLEMVKFFQTGKPPVPPEETLEIIAFLDAAQRSKEQGGKPVDLR
jgi:predicted dehydrogenase